MMFGNSTKLKLVNLKSLINDTLITNYIDDNSKVSNSENKHSANKNGLKTSNIIIYNNFKNGTENKSFSLKIKKNNNKIKNNNRFHLSLNKSFIGKIKYYANKSNEKFMELNTYPFNFNNLKYLNVQNDKEKINKNKGLLIKSNFKKKIPIKYSYPKIESNLINIYNKIISNIKANNINNDNNLNKTIVNSIFNKNLKIFTNYIKENANQVIKKRISELKKNISENDKKENNYYYNPLKEEEMKFNVMLLDNWRNVKINNYSPLKNYSICPIKTEIDIFKNRNNTFKRYHIYKKYKIKDKNPKIKKSNSHKIVNNNKKILSYEKLMKEKSNNIFFEYYSCLSDISPEIIEKNENEIKAYLNILYLMVKLNKKTLELNEAIKKSQNKIESNVKEIKSKTTKLIENINNITNISNALTNDIILHNCQKSFAQIKLRSSYHQMNQLKNNFEENSKKAQIGEKEGIMLKEAFNNKIIALKNEIKNIKINVRESKEAAIKYYLNILKDGNDNRNVGLSWIVKRLFRLDYIPKLEDFPEYMNKKIFEFIIEKAKIENIILDCFQELGEIKASLFEEENDNNNKKDNLNYSFNCEDIYEYKNNEIENKYSYKNKLKNKLKKLLDKFGFLVISPEIKGKMDEFFKTIAQKEKKKDKFIDENEIKNDLILKKNNFLYYFENNFNNDNKSDKNIFNNIKRVLELKNIIYDSYSKLNNLFKEEIKYIKNLIKDRNGNIIENLSLLKRKINNNSIKIIRNLIGDENKIKNFNKYFI